MKSRASFELGSTGGINELVKSFLSHVTLTPSSFAMSVKNLCMVEA
eukprot:CAMPEP_0197498364 /NCGR_PEP_ID=MMETSP1311-20131121/57249_1 /TAXON_ID=464262 /ORGANISM="Genus nov. species nov., Strain RCC856" /LENGTH=45 /DNA_ID= /DNA_START= /DNA_END= /DNA_ORIENTATION=